MYAFCSKDGKQKAALSFAQFEREVTGERIRDKKKAMAMKGMWGSGVTPFGYDRIEKKLVPNPDHAERVRKIFDLYIELRSVNMVKRRLQELNIQTQNGRDWSDGNLYNILQRKLYLGKIEHHKEVYDGQHEAIVDKEVFRKAQQMLDTNKRRSTSKVSHAPCHPWQAWHTQHPVAKGKHNSLLAGKIFDSEGYAMSPSYSAKRPPGRGECRVGTDARERRGRRYRYYISQAYLRKEKDKAGNLPQVPAVSIEELVAHEVQELLYNQLPLMEGRLEQQQAYEENWNKFTESEWHLLNPKVFTLIRQTLQKLVVSNRGIEFTLDRENLQIIAEAIFRNYPLPEELPTSENTISYTKLCKIEQVRHGKSFVIAGRMPEMPHLHGCKSAAEGQNQRNESRSPWMGGVLACHGNFLCSKAAQMNVVPWGGHNASLVNALKQAWEWNDWISEGKITSIQELSEKLGISRRYVDRVLNMRYLSPKIQLMILRGTQPLNWTTHTFMKALPSDWGEQEKELSL